MPEVLVSSAWLFEVLNVLQFMPEILVSSTRRLPYIRDMQLVYVLMCAMV